MSATKQYREWLPHQPPDQQHLPPLVEQIRRNCGRRGREEYARRKVIPEPVFGQIRIGQGFQQFLLRGLDKVQAEWSLVCAGHNLLKIWRAGGTISA